MIAQPTSWDDISIYPIPPLESPELPQVKLKVPIALCNCFQYLKQTYYPNLPPDETLITLAGPEIADVVVMYYPDSNLYHFAKVLGETETAIVIDETNFIRCQQTTRTVDKASNKIKGYVRL